MKFTPHSRLQLAALLLVVGLLLSVLPDFALAADSPTELATKAGDWTDLTPTVDLKGWTRIPVPQTHTLGRAQWHLDTSRQVLVCDGDGGHEMLRFDKELTNCIFHVEFRFVPVSEGKSNYNSGVFIRNSADGTIWHQCQLTIDGGYLFGNTPTNGLLKRFKSPAHELRMKPAGEWNTVEVAARGHTLTVWFNGTVVSEFGDCQMPGGFIALESEGYAIEFQNLKLRELP